MGNPINAVAWLANKLHEYGVTPQAGHVILSGSFIKAIPFQAGDNVEALFNGLGEVTFRAADRRSSVVDVGDELAGHELGAGHTWVCRAGRESASGKCSTQIGLHASRKGACRARRT